MTKKRKAKICDSVLLRFKGDKTFYWRDLHGNNYLFNDIIIDSDVSGDLTPHNKFLVIQAHLNLLLADEMIFRKSIVVGEETLCLTDKGNHTVTDLKNYGYATKYKKEFNENLKKNVLVILSIATFILLCYKTCNSSTNKEIHPADTTQVSNPTQTSKENIPVDITNRNYQINKDTIPKQIQLKTK